jgi:hypothetical protein
MDGGITWVITLVGDAQTHGPGARPSHSRGVFRWARGRSGDPVDPVPCYFKITIANQVIARDLRWSTGWCGGACWSGCGSGCRRWILSNQGQVKIIGRGGFSRRCRHRRCRSRCGGVSLG